VPSGAAVVQADIGLADLADAEAMGLGSIADAGSVNRRAVLRRGQVSEGAPMVEFMRARRRHGVEERYPPLKGTKRTSQLSGIQNRREAFSSGQPPLTRGKNRWAADDQCCRAGPDVPVPPLSRCPSRRYRGVGGGPVMAAHFLGNNQSKGFRYPLG
jgi:hypothetical protein